MISFPNAKINIGLFITDKRSDGYHSIESIFYPVKINDTLEIGAFETAEKTFNFYGTKIEGEIESNLITKAWKLIQQFEIDKYGSVSEKSKSLKFYLQKNIPTGAGLGGGSSDGSLALKMMNEILELKISNEELEKMALKLGSDCPFFIRNSPALVKGRGEIISDFTLDLSGLYLVLIHPGIHISTADAYSKITPVKANLDWKEITRNNITDWKNLLKNDFEKSIFELNPAIEKVKNSLYNSGAIYAQMSGSGSAVFGIFNELPNEIKSAFPDNYKLFTCEL